MTIPATTTTTYLILDPQTIGCDYHRFKLVRLCASYFGVTTTLGLESLPFCS